MGTQPVAVVDTNVLLNLATPVVDGRPIAPSGDDPLKAVLASYDVHVPASVLGEVTTTTDGNDPLAAAAELVLAAADALTTNDIDAIADGVPFVGLDEGEIDAIRLANELPADLFVTDEFNTTNYLVISQAIDDRNTLFTTPHVMCNLAHHGVLDPRYVWAALTYYIETKGWDRTYVESLRDAYLD